MSKPFFCAVLDHSLKLRAVIRFGRKRAVNVVTYDSYSIFLCIRRVLTNLTFDRLLTLIVRGITRINNASHLPTSFLLCMHTLYHIKLYLSRKNTIILYKRLSQYKNSVYATTKY